VERAVGVVDSELRGCLRAELSERNRALERRFMLVAIDKFIHVAHRHAHIELAGYAARRIARSGNELSYRQIAIVSESGSGGAGEIPADQFFVERHADTVRQLHIEEWSENRIDRQARSSDARQHVVEAKLAAAFSVEEPERRVADQRTDHGGKRSQILAD